MIQQVSETQVEIQMTIFKQELNLTKLEKALNLFMAFAMIAVAAAGGVVLIVTTIWAWLPY